MMHWDLLRQQWQHAVMPGADLSATVQRTHERSRQLRRRILMRDWMETLIGLAMVPLFAAAAVIAARQGAWLTVGFASLLVAWLLFMPWWLWRARRRLPVPRADRPLVEFLHQERDAMIDQATLFRNTWRWCLGPVAIGTIGFYASVRGLGLSSAVYAAIVLSVYVGIDRYQQHVARRRFLARVDEIDRLLSELETESHP